MSCSALSNTGFVHFTGPIQPSELKSITDISYFPLTFAFSSRSTIPTLLASNQIEGGMGNSCVYLGKRYNLTNIQVCSPLHKGYKLPGETQTSVAECILTYAPSDKSQPPVSGIIICFPIYDSGTPAYDGYLDQIVNDTEIQCGYENVIGKMYEGSDQQTIKDTSLRQCIKSCCDDTNCLAYSFGNGTCHIKHTIPNLLSTGDGAISGKINRNIKPTCSPSSTPTSLVNQIESMFYQPDGSTTHSIIAYKTCIETNRGSEGLYVFVFPKGIRMRSSSYQQLVLRLNGTLSEYTIPMTIRGDNMTLLRYRMDNGRKLPIEYSAEGKVYITTVSTCTEEFYKGFEHFILPSRKNVRTSSGAQTSRNNTNPSQIVESFTSSPSESDGNSCRRLTTQQYKCVPFNEATDLSGNIVIPGNTTLDDILKKQKENKAKQNQGTVTAPGTETLSSEAIEGIIGGSIGGIILFYLGYRGITYIFNRPT
jgi:hypothetical protein